MNELVAIFLPWFLTFEKASQSSKLELSTFLICWNYFGIWTKSG